MLALEVYLVSLHVMCFLKLLVDLESASPSPWLFCTALLLIEELTSQINFMEGWEQVDQLGCRGEQQ